MTVFFVQQPPMSTEDCFEHYWRQEGEWVEEPNRRRGGESGVQRIHEDGKLLYAKRQVGHIYRSWRYPQGRPTVLRERDALLGLRELNVNVPELVFCGAKQAGDKQWRALLVTASLDGYIEIEKWYAAGGRERFGERRRFGGQCWFGEQCRKRWFSGHRPPLARHPRPRPA